jgi:hypothetical protein
VGPRGDGAVTGRPRHLKGAVMNWRERERDGGVGTDDTTV